MRYLKHITTVLIHKWYVFVAGLKTGAPLWKLIIHDWSKFSPSEFCAYADNFHAPEEWRKEEEANAYAKYAIDALIPYGALTADRFDLAWLHHQNANPHHWEHWLRRPSGTPAEMPEWAVREMVADWMAAGRVYEGEWPAQNGWQWLRRNASRMRLNGTTIERLNMVLGEVGCPVSFYAACAGEVESE